MSPKAPSQAWGVTHSSGIPHNEDTVRGRAELLTLQGPWVKEAATESNDIKEQYMR